MVDVVKEAFDKCGECVACLFGVAFAFSGIVGDQEFDPGSDLGEVIGQHPTGDVLAAHVPRWLRGVRSPQRGERQRTDRDGSVVEGPSPGQLR